MAVGFPVVEELLQNFVPTQGSPASQESFRAYALKPSERQSWKTAVAQLMNVAECQKFIQIKCTTCDERTRYDCKPTLDCRGASKIADSYTTVIHAKRKVDSIVGRPVDTSSGTISQGSVSKKWTVLKQNHIDPAKYPRRSDMD